MCLTQISRLLEWAEMSVWSTVNAEFGPLDRAELTCLLVCAFEAQNPDLKAILKLFPKFEKVSQHQQWISAQKQLQFKNVSEGLKFWNDQGNRFLDSRTIFRPNLGGPKSTFFFRSARTSFGLSHKYQNFFLEGLRPPDPLIHKTHLGTSKTPQKSFVYLTLWILKNVNFII